MDAALALSAAERAKKFAELRDRKGSRISGATAARPADGEPVTIPSGTLQLKALLWRPESSAPLPAVLFHHGAGCADVPAAAATLGRRFAARGYAFLWLYRRGAGASRGQGDCAREEIARVRTEQGDAAALALQLRLLTTTELADAMAGLAALRGMPQIDGRRIVVAGHSFGAQLALLTAERDPAIRAVLTFAGAAAVWSRAAGLRERLMHALKGIQAPLYLAYAEDDNAEPGRSLGAELTRLGKVHRLAIYSSGGHGFVYRSAHPSKEDVFRFLSEYVK